MESKLNRHLIIDTDKQNGSISARCWVAEICAFYIGTEIHISGRLYGYVATVRTCITAKIYATTPNCITWQIPKLHHGSDPGEIQIVPRNQSNSYLAKLVIRPCVGKFTDFRSVVIQMRCKRISDGNFRTNRIIVPSVPMCLFSPIFK